MNILVSTDKNYLKYLRVLMASVYANNDTNVDFYVMHDSLTEEEKRSVCSFAETFKQNVYFLYVDVSKIDMLLSQFKSARYSPPTLFPLFAHEFLPDDMDRILYLDIDMAVTGNLTDFYNLEFDDCYLIASKPQYNVKDEPSEEFASFERIDNYEIAHAAAGDYFNAGSVLFNLVKLRNAHIDLRYYVEKIQGIDNIFYDQGILNICFAKEAKILTTCAYNYRLHYSAKNYFNRKNNYSHGKREYTFYPFTPKIIHYCGILPGANIKSWTFYFERENEVGDPRKEFFDMIPECVPYFNNWWKYAKMTPDYEQL